MLNERHENYASKIADNKRYIDVHTGIQKVLSEPASFITFDSAPFVTYRKLGLSVDFICSKMRHFKVPGSTASASMFLKKGSNLKEMFNIK